MFPFIWRSDFNDSVAALWTEINRLKQLLDESGTERDQVKTQLQHAMLTINALEEQLRETDRKAAFDIATSLDLLQCIRHIKHLANSNESLSMIDAATACS